MISPRQTDTLVVFESPLGWAALMGRDALLRQLVIGHPSLEAAVAALDAGLREGAGPGQWNPGLVQRLQAYFAGEPQDFGDVRVEARAATGFARRVLEACRRIPFGTTVTYGQLAARAGSPRAARAVGNCMAGNRTPIIVPCHRVVGSGGQLGGFSGPGGVKLKRRLLALEGL